MNTVESLFSEYLIKQINNIHEIVSLDTIQQNTKNISSIPSLRDWLDLYRNSKKALFCSLYNLLSTSSHSNLFLEQLSFYFLGNKEKLNIVNNAQNEINAMSDAQKNDFSRQIADYCTCLKQEIVDLFSEEYDHTSPDELKIIISDPCIQFFLRITVPCLVLYGQLPSQLIRKARLGDTQAIRQLVQIDITVLKDNKISKFLHKTSFTDPQGHRVLIQSFSNEHPRPEIKDLKIDFAALISQINILFSTAQKIKPMPTTHIRKLFVDEAKLHGQHDDIDLPPGDEAFYKRIKRNTKWKNLIKYSDKK